MIRLLTAGTALAALLATGALAQTASSAMPDPTASTSAMASSDTGMSSAMGASDMGASNMGSSAMTTSSEMNASMTSSAMSSAMTTASTLESSMMSSVQPFSITSGYAIVDTDQLATKIIGAHVYDGTAQNADDLGKINDLVINQDGSVAAVVLGVGGFLGIGEKQVAVDFHALQWEMGPDNNRRFVLQTTKDELTQAPDFKTVDNPTANGASAAPAADANASAAPMAPASAMAPASGVDANSMNAASGSSAQ